MRGGRGRRRRGGHGEEHGNDERWLLTYSDMITLLMALFIVMYSISSVNTSKFKSLHASLQDAFSGRILPGGRSIMDAGAADVVQKQLSAVNQASTTTDSSGAAQLELQDFQGLKERIDRYAREHGLQDRIRTTIDRRGLSIVVLTDNLLFDSGSAVLQPQGVELMHSIGAVLREEGSHHVLVEGYTDSVPITGRYPSNWELSTARASTVVRTLIAARVAPQRLTATGRAYLDPVASNATAAGRSRNRRVQIVLPREAGGAADAADAVGAEPSIGPSDVVIGPKETTP